MPDHGTICPSVYSGRLSLPGFPDMTVSDWKVEKALRMVQEGRWTVRRAAKFASLSYHEILEKMTTFGVDSGPTVTDLRKSLDRRRRTRVSNL